MPQPSSSPANIQAPSHPVPAATTPQPPAPATPEFNPTPRKTTWATSTHPPPKTQTSLQAPSERNNLSPPVAISDAAAAVFFCLSSRSETKGAAVVVAVVCPCRHPERSEGPRSHSPAHTVRTFQPQIQPLSLRVLLFVIPQQSGGIRLYPAITVAHLPVNPLTLENPRQTSTIAWRTSSPHPLY
jgi:hypothetical protein